MDFARQQRDPKRHVIGIGFVILVHALVIYALLTGMGQKIIQVIKKPLTATIIEEIKLPPPPPPPPPPKKIIDPPKVQPLVQPYVPPPDIPMVAPPTEPVISSVAVEPPKETFVIQAPPAVVAPPAPPAPPPKPAVRRGITKLSGSDPSYPRAAIRAGVSQGRVVARVNIDEKGNVTAVTIVSSNPPRVFDSAVREALETWKFPAEGDKYVGEIEVNFSLKDE